MFPFFVHRQSIHGPPVNQVSNSDVSKVFLVLDLKTFENFAKVFQNVLTSTSPLASGIHFLDSKYTQIKK